MRVGRHSVTLRNATHDDMAAVRDIYAHHVLEDMASFEEVAPDISEMTRRFRAVLKRRLPFIVAELDGAVKGYAYAGPYRSRPAYRYTVEDSIYVAPDASGRGLGRLLLSRLIEDCTARGYRRMVAMIGGSGNKPSINLHAKLGFEKAGLLPSMGFKLGRWVDQVIMVRPLGPGDGEPPE